MTARTNLFVVALALALLGTVMVYSATAAQSGTYLLAVRSAHVVLAIGTFFAVRQVRYVLWRKLALPVYDAQIVGYPQRMRDHDARERILRRRRNQA